MEVEEEEEEDTETEVVEEEEEEEMDVEEEEETETEVVEEEEEEEMDVEEEEQEVEGVRRERARERDWIRRLQPIGEEEKDEGGSLKAMERAQRVVSCQLWNILSIASAIAIRPLLYRTQMIRCTTPPPPSPLRPNKRAYKQPLQHTPRPILPSIILLPHPTLPPPALVPSQIYWIWPLI